MSEAINKVKRLWEIPGLLSRKPRATQELAAYFNVPSRTIQRDLKLLREEGLNITEQQRGVYFIPAPPTSLNALEALAVHAATRLLYHHAPARSRFYQSAMEKLAAMLPEPARTIAYKSAEGVLAKPGDDRTLEFVARAWFEQRVLVFNYTSASGSGKPRPKELEVYFIEINRSNLAPYAIGYERSYHKSVMTWKLSRMQQVRLLEDTYIIPDTFDPQAYLSTAWGVIGTSGGPSVTVRLKFNAEGAKRIREGGYPNLSIAKHYSDGSIEVSIQAGSDDKGFPLEMLSWVQSWGAKVEVLEPDNLRERWLEEARVLVLRHTDVGVMD